MANVPLTDNCTDLSSNRGAHFKFLRRRSGNRYLNLNAS